MERRLCPNVSNIDEDVLYKFVRSKDTCSVFAKKLIGWHGSEDHEATESAWNGYAHECYPVSVTGTLQSCMD